MTEIQKILFELQDKEYAEFQSKLTPTVELESFIGVRVPKVRELAKKHINDDVYREFLNHLPHDYYDENMLHGMLISEIKDYEECIRRLDEFLPYVDNWAVCDTISPKIFKKHKTELLEKIHEWISSDREYTVRFGIGMLMSHFLDEDFKSEYLELVASIHTDKYYINMMIAWFFSTALCKQWYAAVKYIENYRLEEWTHNKTITKACESYRLAPELKNHLRKYRV